MNNTNMREEVRRELDHFSSEQREQQRIKSKKRHLTKLVINLAWFFFGWAPVLFSNFLRIYLATCFVNPQVGATIASSLITLGWISIPLALILAIYHLIKWINV